MRNFTFFTLLLFFTNFCHSQENEVILTINSLDSITRNTIVFNGQIQNKSDDLQEILPLNYDCDNNTFLHFWDIQITHNGLSYSNPFELVILGYNPRFKNFWKIKKEKTCKFTFCIDFSKLATTDNENKLLDKNNYINMDFGKYNVRLLYTFYNQEKNKVNSLESNILTIKYRE